jgi:hypothetical protein
MGKLKDAFMTIIYDDMGGSDPVDVELVKSLMKSGNFEEDTDFQIGLIIHSINSDISRLTAFRGSLSPFAGEIDIITARLTKLAEKALGTVK